MLLSIADLIFLKIFCIQTNTLFNTYLLCLVAQGLLDVARSRGTAPLLSGCLGLLKDSLVELSQGISGPSRSSDALNKGPDDFLASMVTEARRAVFLHRLPDIGIFDVFADEANASNGCLSLAHIVALVEVEVSSDVNYLSCMKGVFEHLLRLMDPDTADNAEEFYKWVYQLAPTARCIKDIVDGRCDFDSYVEVLSTLEGRWPAVSLLVG